jgi:thiol-disulfide isomerase/thioredoxin
VSCLRCCRCFKLRFALLAVLMPAIISVNGIADEVKPDSAEAAVPESQENAPEAKTEAGAESGPSQIAKKSAAPDEPPQNPFPQAVAVPDGILDGGTEWLNTSHPIDLKDLRGKVVLLDFWTYCCINCIHVLPDLKYLEEKYGNQLVVIGVHSAKFDNEKVSQNIRDAILRYEIQHPVINDSEMLLWRKFGVQAWPTLALVDPEGKYAGSQGGEGNRELFDNVIGKLVEYHRWKGTLDETPIVFESEASKIKPTPLRYPGKVLADAAGKRLFITDSNHNRIVVTTLDGELQQLIGSGRIGRTDGTFEEAEFNRPQGTVLVGNKLYVSDTENHLLRVVDLETKMVSTLAGTGEQGPPGGKVRGPLLETPLNSPWSIAPMGETLYIAMAGPHQIWSHKLGSNVIGVFAGSGREDVINGSLTASAFAQPSEIVADSAGRSLYLVDSEGSAIREIVPARNKVTTIAGTSELPRGQSLFAFGDVDGVGAQARFQHPLGIAIAGENLLVADSYNHKLRAVNPKTGKTTTWAGTGDPGDSVEPLALNEPGGLSVAEGRLFVADTNNHRILSIDLATQKALVLPITGLTPPSPAKRGAAVPDSSDAINVDAQKIAVTDKLKFAVTLTIPEGFKRNDLAPVTWEVFAEGEQALVAADLLGARDEATTNDQNVAQFELPLNGQPGEATLIVRMSYGYCGTEENALCRLASAAWKIPVVLNTEGGVAEIALTFPQP